LRRAASRGICCDRSDGEPSAISLQASDDTFAHVPSRA
jgi:hypothetical protein